MNRTPRCSCQATSRCTKRGSADSDGNSFNSNASESFNGASASVCRGGGGDDGHAVLRQVRRSALRCATISQKLRRMTTLKRAATASAKESRSHVQRSDNSDPSSKRSTSAPPHTPLQDEPPPLSS